MGQLQLLMFGALAFCLLILSGYYPAEMRAINLDTDWFYRKLSLRLYRFSDYFLNKINQACETIFTQKLPIIWPYGRKMELHVRWYF